MPKIKDAQQRLVIMDQILSRMTVKNREEFLRLVNNQLDNDMQISVFTLDKDLNELRNLVEAEGVTIPRNAKGFSYSRQGYSHYKQQLNDDDRLMLIVAQNLFQVFRNSRLGNRFRELIEKVIDKKGARAMWEEIGRLDFVQLEGRLIVPGTEHLPDLIEAIHDKKQISFRYRKDGKKRIVSPYLLQQNNQHWYLIGYNHAKQGDEAILVYALEKMSDILPAPGPYYRQPGFRPDLYFRHSLGIWQSHEKPPVKVILKVLDPDWYERLKASKLHPSQKDLGSGSIQIEVYETPELYRLILGFGAEVRVIQPASVKNEIKRQIGLMGQRY
jgi:predicted DNA-binding transcriptional regulator YafY